MAEPGLEVKARAEGPAVVITLPAAFARQYGIKPGTKLVIKPYMTNAFYVEVK